MSATDRVAIVVAHGIADQRPRQTVREVARLLCRGGPDRASYVQGEMQDVLVPVEPLPPGDRVLQDASSRQRPGTPSGFYQAQQSAEVRAQGPKQPSPETQDLGMALNDYLLGRLALPESDALYESTRVRLRRRADGRPLDVYEMYWADLSRLGTGGLRALTSLYQLFFHLSTLAADVIDHVALSTNGGGAWRLLQRLHAWMAWIMKGPAALLQLAMLLLIVFGAAALVHPDVRGQLVAAVFGFGGVVLAGLAVLAWLRGAPGLARWAKLALLLAIASFSLAFAFLALAAGVAPVVYFVACALGIGLLGGYLIERYSGVTRGVRLLGHVIVLATVLMVWIAGQLVRPTTEIEWMLLSGLSTGEMLYGGVLIVWAVFVAVQIIALTLGLWLGRGCDQAARASLHTARLALIGSTGLFAVLSLVLWSVVSYIAGRALSDFLYLPHFFGRGYRSAAFFLDDRVQALGGFFTPLVAGFALAVAAAMLVLLPSLIEEIKPSTNVDESGAIEGAAEWARRLGNWLTGGVRALGEAFTALIPVAAIAGGALYLAFVLEEFGDAMNIGGDLDWLVRLLDMFQGETLVATGKWLAGGALTIAALGSRFTETFGRLRVGIDAVLDIDNYFADPPNRQPPRARIYSRYASLLSHLRDAGYARLVIVAHSQGSVISAELFRYLHVQGRLRDVVGSMRIALVTVGSPLRDLYAERFPLLYRWMGSRERGFANAGPAAADVGATEWVNACRSGDYVGRFLWTPHTDASRFTIATVDPDGQVAARRAGDRTEFCLGAGGHTHYFSDDAVALAAEIERLVAGAS
ncbi:MAG TPA: hypothetical protein VFR66_07090 [Burkholderiales bacterium]|nr:hypothetical protein [Burkholderiales bacterium]